MDLTINKKSYRNADFKKYYCNTNKRHYYVLGYFGGGAINCSKAISAAQDFAEETGVDIDSVLIDEIMRSRRFQHFKYLFSTQEGQTPLDGSKIEENVFNWLND